MAFKTKFLDYRSRIYEIICHCSMVQELNKNITLNDESESSDDEEGEEGDEGEAIALLAL